jgi:hypothetical protein
MADDTTPELSKEELVIKAMKLTLVDVIRDTTVAPGIKHPLSERTIQGIRDCLVLITDRERELAEAAGRGSTARPVFADDPRRPAVVPVSDLRRKSEPEP